MVVVDVYIPSKVGRKSGQKYGFIRFDEFYHGKSAIEAQNGESVNGHKLERTSSRPGKQREEPQKKIDNQQFASPYKQTLLSYPNSNMLEAPNGCENDVHEGLSDNSKTITQALDDAHNHPIFVGKFPSQAPSCGSSMEDDEEINSSLRLFDSTLEMDIQLHEKREMTKRCNKGKNSGNRNSRSMHNSPAPTEIAKKALDVGTSSVFLSSEMRTRQLEGSQEV
ncbi:hypothetical protein Cgig2_018615 [Carnegiea gigantea]|uniref:RRM domain-containing protein n=1 Tax=Carnegiea gigantea TaxID=171969 RepID=A0A9Q1KGC4_9CARY|nr:hypothetical protein Cgig2_018615 [Carnegiea gigantea]